ncbi:N-methyl-L-tryptophan oxidase [Rhodococcus sp. IEGM 1379]|uniref:N-methyl-L-tryptophan oxidase n=1 Tax=Rhodococcus sp. IEGM 1379 TaxID=3047086 RepID=UPI0024B6FC00|nr:N-methyl-L-tryptophan oxidase [Rhodococcus sp. IEGM 1379]MDI9914000.1 N-methyl-L-tryptophan oxidase [Rhodococcus sp. IEGM 1379]
MTSGFVDTAAIDVATERAETPGWAGSHHLNAAGAALPTAAVLSAVESHLRLESRLGGYEADALVRDRIDAVYGLAAGLLGADETDIALMQSATTGWQRIIEALRLGAGDRVLVSRSTYVSSAINLLELEKSLGIVVEIIPSDDSGRIDLERLEQALERPARLVTVAHVPTSSGLIEPVDEVGALCRSRGVLFLLDATQSVGQLPVDVRTIGCDILVATGRKFLRGPRGTGLLYVSPTVRESLRPLSPDVRGAEWSSAKTFELDSSAKRFETWEAPHALQLGFGVALAQAQATGIEVVAAHVEGLASRMRSRLSAIKGVTVVDPPASGGGIVTFIVSGQDPRETKEVLRRKGIRVVAVPASHGQWDLGHRGLECVVRASVHVYNDTDDLDALEAALLSSAGGPVVVNKSSSLGSTARGTSVVERVEHTDVVVVGGGIYGSSTAWHLARRGLRVVNLEQFGGMHSEGSSHGRTRMIRRAYPNPIWYPLVDKAYEAWADVEEQSDSRLITTTGGLYARAIDADSGLDGPNCELLEHDQAAQLFPGLVLGSGFRALYDPAAGVIDAENALAQLRILGWRSGVDRRESSRVVKIETDGDGAIVTTTAGRIRADRVVVCAGPWTSSLLPEFESLLDVVRIVNIHVDSAKPELLSPPGLGVFSVEVPGVGLLYGIPAIGGSGVKVGLDHGPADDLSVPRRSPTEVEIETLHALVRRFLPAADGAVEEALSCRYTMAPQNRFAVGALPGRPQILVGAACSGHGFKFGPAIGAALADMATGIARPDLDFISPGAMLATDALS